MKIIRSKLLKDFVLKRKEIEEQNGPTSVQRIAIEMGVRYDVLFKWIVGRINPTPYDLAKICRWLGKKVDDYIEK